MSDTMTLPVPIFAMGQRVFSYSVNATRAQHPCPDCLGTKVWTVTTPAGTTLEAACGRCTAHWVGDGEPSSLVYKLHVHSVRELTIGSITAKTSDYDGTPAVEYMCRETGVGSGTVYRENRLFETREQADRAGAFDAQIANGKESSKANAVATKRLSGLTVRDAALKQAGESVWQAWWSYRRLKEDIERWAEETTLSDDAKEAIDDLLRWESEARDSPEPELCKALKAAWPFVHDAQNDEDGDAANGARHACELIRAALAKAEGRTP